MRLPGTLRCTRGCINTIPTFPPLPTCNQKGNLSTSHGCNTPAGTINRLWQGSPLNIAPPAITPSAFLGPPPQPDNLAPAVGAFDPNLRNPSVHEWDLTIQRELPLH